MYKRQTQNAEDSIGLIKTAEGALTEVHSMLQRMSTLATQAANGTYNSVARSNIQSEITELNAEIDRIAKNTDFNGIKPISAKGMMTFQIGPSSAETIKVTLQGMASKDIGVDKINVSSAKNSDGIKKANEAINTIRTAIDKVSQFRAKLGAAQNRLEHTVNNLRVTSENLTAAESRIRDTDMADEITAFTKNNILLQSSQSMLAQSNAAPQGILNLLR